MKALNLTSILAAPVAVTIATIAGATQAQAQSITCGQSYVVKTGDSLSQIAQRAYGSPSAFQLIYSANAAKIGKNPSLIQRGAVFDIPCLDNLGTSTANAGAIRTQDTTSALPPPEARQIRIVTATDWAPFLDEDQEQGGMLTEVTNVAMSVADNKPSYKIDFINDWGSHIRPLLSDHAYDLGIAWFRPNCAVVDRLSEDSQFRCNNLDWSDPLFEQIVGYYTRVGDPRPAAPKDLLNKTLCRPSGYSTFMMEEVGLMEPAIKLVRENTTTGCFEGLLDGRFDAVVLATDTADGAIAKTGATGKVTLNENLSYVATLHAVTAKTNPNGKLYLASLNSGLKKIKSSGEWFRIIARHMAEFRAKTKTN